jgi:glutathione reductase (NADPH)
MIFDRRRSVAAEFDLFVIGAGSGGVRAARVAASHGARVAIAEESRFGGTCVIRGCVPKKLFVLASRFADAFERAPGYGWTIDHPRFEWPRLREAKDQEISRLEGIYRRNLESSGVKTLASRAVIEDAHTVRLLADDSLISARHILIATGGRAARTAIPGAELALISDDLFELSKLPQTLLIEGGGFIAVEFACLLARLGVGVTLVYRGERILRGFDDDCRAHLQAAMQDHGIRIITGCTLQSIKAQGAGREVRLSDGRVLEADAVLMATGRVPNTQGLGLERVGVSTDARGAVKVDADSRSSQDSIWAVGDVTDRLALTPVAIREGHAFADTVFGSRPWCVDHHDVPVAVFATPELASVGLTETQAREQVSDIKIFRTSFRPMSSVLSTRLERTLMKLVVDARSDRVLGVHVCGEDAAEIVQMAAIAVKMGATKAQFDATVALHPSAAEELVTLRTPVA